jgi:isochorismate hydrolase
MPQTRNRPIRSDKGLLTPDNCAVAIIDHQPQMLFGVNDFDRQALINNVQLLVKAARLFDVPLIVSTVETRSFSGLLWPQLQALLPERPIIERTSMNAWDDAAFVAAVEATGQKRLLLSGLWTETCIALPAVQALHDGYDIYVVEDTCADINRLSHENAMRRVIQAGAKPVTALSVMLEWQRDWAARDTYAGVIDIVKSHCGAYGMGVEYAYTMVHGAPPTSLPAWRPTTGAVKD